MSRKLWIGGACGIMIIAIPTFFLRRPLPRDDLDVARAALATGERTRALEELNVWIARHSEKDANDPKVPFALLMRGGLLVDLGDGYAALHDYERIATGHPQSPEFAEAVERELSIGIKLVRGEIVGGRFGNRKESEGLGEELLVRVGERLPGSAHSETASWELACLYDRANKLNIALAAYEIFVQQFPSSAHRASADQRVKALEKQISP
ncbi:MAG: hypothetical protein ACKVW3_18095 [Phycisphaerales bacterium]